MIKNSFMALWGLFSISDIIESFFNIDLSTWENAINSLINLVIGGLVWAFTRSIGGLAAVIWGFANLLINFIIQNYPSSENSFAKMIVGSIIKKANEVFNALKCRKAIEILSSDTEEFFNKGTDLTEMIKEIFDMVVMPSAMVVFSLIIMVELFQITTRTEGMRNSGFEAPFKLMVKVAICKIFLDRSYDVLHAIIKFSNEMFSGLYNLMSIMTYNPVGFDEKEIAHLSELHYIVLVTWWLSIWVLYGCVILIIEYILPFVVLARLLEINMMIALAPLPFATFANQEFSQVGKNFIKQFIGITLKSFVIYLIIIIYSAAFSCLMIRDDSFTDALHTLSSFSPLTSLLSVWAPLFIFIGQVAIKPLIFSFMLMGTIFAADRYTKLITGAFY